MKIKVQLSLGVNAIFLKNTKILREIVKLPLLLFSDLLNEFQLPV